MRDLFSSKEMISPDIIRIAFAIASGVWVAVILFTVWTFATDEVTTDVWTAVLTATGSLFAIRILAGLIILQFRINETLTEISDQFEKNQL